MHPKSRPRDVGDRHERPKCVCMAVNSIREVLQLLYLGADYPEHWDSQDGGVIENLRGYRSYIRT